MRDVSTYPKTVRVMELGVVETFFVAGLPLEAWVFFPTQSSQYQLHKALACSRYLSLSEIFYCKLLCMMVPTR